METITIDIINPKANKLLKDLESLDLISIRKKNTSDWKQKLKIIRKNNTNDNILDEITKEVELVRKKRYEHQ
jgi:hypothetical protein